MADVIRKSINKFNKGIVMDFSPENSKNDTLTHALNATLLTFNGNELSLQNDMGNARVETAFLPEGYIPVGTCEYGGIIYIVSYNPLEDKSQIGCFPSPERSISSDEIGITEKIKNSDFQGENGKIKNNSKYVLLKTSNLNPGDKFMIYANQDLYDERLENLIKESALVENPILSLNIVSIEDSGKIVYLNNTVRQYSKSYNEKTYAYHIIGTDLESSEIIKKDIDSYRNVLSSGYNVFKSKTSGKLAILAELITIDSYSITHSIQAATDENGNIIEGSFDVIIHPEISPEITESNRTTIPKASRYFLEKSEGVLQMFDNTGKEQRKLLSDGFSGIKLKDIYTPINTDLNLEEELNPDNFRFPNKETYHSEVLDDTSYTDIKLANIEFPQTLTKNNLDLPFKYEYTLVPCMEYGKLEHLAVSNTIDFGKLRDFNQSKFTTWKYHIDENQLRLTFGAEIYDTYEEHKVDGLVLEFYDLWGFAGSLEISNKKSYSGIFTKIISLNTLNALSTQRIDGNTYSRNINIIKDNEDFKYNSNIIKNIPEKGWIYSDDENPIDSDCGTLYSNLVYGVKAYLRRTVNGKKDYIQKDEFFLYTIPIYNNYYYTVDNFNNLKNPKLELLLTYKLLDNSSIIPYTSDSNNESVTNGYLDSDYAIVDNYISGKCLEPSINFTRYYQYSGVSKLYLEVGLKQEYQNFNLSYSPELNKIFTCNLKLLGNSESSYTIYNGNEVLPSDHNVNYKSELSFSGKNSELLVEDLTKCSFIRNEGKSPIEISYNFILGHSVTIDKIRETQIPVTTACALFHITDSGEYNLSDFNIYTLEDGSQIKYLSNGILYNSGSSDKEIFGICQQIKTEGSITEQCQSIFSTETEAQTIKTPGKLNTGNPLDQVSSYIGKLSFYQPNAHGLSDDDKVNINTNYIIDKNTCYDAIIKNPRYNLVANTKNSMLYHSEFISALDYTNNNSYFTGITGGELETFNRKLLKTMTNVYACNPDYDSASINVGDISITDLELKIASDLISTNASLNFNGNSTLNDYIYIGSVKFSDYLNYLNTYSDITIKNNNNFIETIQFSPDFKYCGVSSETPYLITSLTYNIPTPKELENELEFNSSNVVNVRHSDKSQILLRGTINDKALYGFNRNKLVQLDVDNYKIDSDGSLNIKKDSYKFGKGVVKLEISSFNQKEPSNKVPLSEISVGFDSFKNDSLNFIPEIEVSNGSVLGVKDNKIYVVRSRTTGSSVRCVIITNNYKSTDYACVAKINNANYTILGKLLNNDMTREILENMANNGPDGIGAMEGIDNLVQDADLQVQINPSVSVKSNRLYWADSDPTKHKVVSQIGNGGIEASMNFEGEGDGSLELYCISLTSIDCIIQRRIKISNSVTSVIPVERTDDYFEYSNNKYQVLSNKYPDVVLCGSSITLNDLIYESNINNHRLFLKSTEYKPNDKLGKIYYRASEDKTISDTRYLNSLSLYTGPCFTQTLFTS